MQPPRSFLSSALTIWVGTTQWLVYAEKGKKRTKQVRDDIQDAIRRSSNDSIATRFYYPCCAPSEQLSRDADFLKASLHVVLRDEYC